MSDLPGLFYTTLYILACIGAGEGLRRVFGLGSPFTRKVIHIGVGMVVWLLPLWFATPWPFIAVCFVFAVINLLDWRYQFFPGMSSADRQNLGTIYFPLAVAGVTALFWDRFPLMIAALMPLTWGDGLAPVVGRALGRHRFRVFGHVRTYEGSAGFFVFAAIFVFLALWLGPPPPALALPQIAGLALLVSGATAVTEAVTPWGLDNLTVTAVAAALLWFLI